MKLYRPSNGTEGEIFKERFCYRCKNFDEFPEGYVDCKLGILMFAELHGIDHPKYPTEWRYDEKGKPTCIKFERLDNETSV